jgi:cell division protein FtsQ
MVEGRVETAAADILAALGAERGSPLLGIDVAMAKTRLESLPWVKSAVVERHLPDTLKVRVEEHKPFALWQLGRRLSVIDREGVVIVREDVARFADRPLVVGKGAELRAAEILDLLASEPALRAEVEAAVLVSGRRWNLRLKGAIEVRLPEEGTKEAWHRLARMAREEALLTRAITIIDLRQPDRAIVRLTPEAAQAPEEPGEST